MNMVPALNIIVGLLLSLAGVIILFRYGMPYKVRTGGTGALLRDEVDLDEIKREQQYDRYGLGGLVLIVLGTVLQAAANLV